METNQRKPTLLAVLAHPDDETFGIGGTLALYARRGANVYLVCATRGEAGEMDERLMRGFSSVAERREAELRCAAEKLGLKQVYFLNYRDSGMPGAVDNQHPQALAAQPTEKIAADIAHYIRLLQPHVVITFDPIGGYGHPDHIAIHKATVHAFELAGNPQFHDDLPPYKAQKLYFQTIPRSFLRAAVWLMRLLGKDPRKFGSNGDIDLLWITNHKFDIHARIDYRKVVKTRQEAAFCHESQGGRQQGSGIMAILRRLFAAEETFIQAYPPPQPGQQDRDLFNGVQLQSKP